MSDRSFLDRLLMRNYPEPEWAAPTRHGNYALSPALAVTDLTPEECERVVALLGPQPLPATTGEMVQSIRAAIDAVRAER